MNKRGAFITFEGCDGAGSHPIFPSSSKHWKHSATAWSSPANPVAVNCRKRSAS